MSIKLSQEQQNAVDLAISPNTSSLLILGKAGVGKSVVLRAIKDALSSTTPPTPFLTLAPTGVSAINVEGITIHKLISMQERGQRTSILKLNAGNPPAAILIDEVSMVRADLMDQLDISLRKILHNDFLPFGGIKVILIGDPGQLPPVAKSDEKKELLQEYRSTFFFSSFAFSQLKPQIIELNKIFRQEVEPDTNLSPNSSSPEESQKQATRYKKMLNFIREGKSIDVITKYLNANHITKTPIGAVLTSRNDKVTSINKQALSNLPGPLFTSNHEIFSHDSITTFYPNEYPADDVLSLKPGAKAMIIKNIYRLPPDICPDIDQAHLNIPGTPYSDMSYYKDLELFLSNGDIVTVADNDPYDPKNNSITVYNERKDITFKIYKDVDGMWTKTEIESYTEEKIHGGQVTVKGKPKTKILASFHQFPLRLAYAMTINKAQGSTIYEPFTIDLTSPLFAEGQFYVALSRGTRLDHVNILGRVRHSDIIISKAVTSFLQKGLLSSYTQVKPGSSYAATLKEIEELESNAELTEAVNNMLDEL